MSACNPTTCYKSSTHRFHLIGPIRHIRHINATSPLSCLVPRVPRSYFPRSCAYSLPRPRHAHGRKSRELLEKEKVVQARKLTLPKYMMPHKNGTSFAAFVSAQSAFHVRLNPTKENPYRTPRARSRVLAPFAEPGYGPTRWMWPTARDHPRAWAGVGDIELDLGTMQPNGGCTPDRVLALPLSAPVEMRLSLSPSKSSSPGSAPGSSESPL